VEADVGLPDHLIHCTACRKPLPATDDEKNILKYFLVGRARIQDKSASGLSHRDLHCRLIFTRGAGLL